MEEFLEKALTWFQHHRGKVLGVVLAGLLGVLFFTIGFWRTLLLVALIVMGYTVGARIDAGETLWRRDTIRLLRRRRD